MSLRLYAVNFWMRVLVKPALARIRRPETVRARFERDAARLFRPPEDAHFVDDLIRRPRPPREVGMIPALWASCGRPDRRKVILYFHGGAYLAGSIKTHRHLAAALAGAAGVRVILPEYRLAPEHPFPAAIEDALSAYRHLLNAGYEPSEIAIAGDSAGGGLAFGLLQALGPAGLPQPAAAVGFSPWADLTGAAESLRRNAARDVLLPVKRMQEVIGYYAGSNGRTDPRLSPALAEWENPPPAMILASRNEILVDDARNLADALRRGGGSVHLELWRSVPHAWPVLWGRLPEANRAVDHAGAFLARQLRAAPPTRELLQDREAA